MRRTYHLCWSGKDETIFRTREDYIHGIICLCIACHETGAKLLAYCFMPNHVHICLRSENVSAFIKAFRYAYSRYFNSKYGRRGRLGERQFFKTELHGLHHIIAVISYILRNPVHHGICRTPFEYEFSSVTAAFATELGNVMENKGPNGKIPYWQIPSRHTLPQNIIVRYNGNILPCSVIDTADLEHQFSTARTYLYFLNRLSGEEWEKEQNKDNSGKPPIKIEDIEAGIKGTTVRQMLANESGRNKTAGINDIELCTLIDEMVARLHSGATVYTITPKQKDAVAAQISKKHHYTSEQISRCLHACHDARKTV